jgi:hypothetical protein
MASSTKKEECLALLGVIASAGIGGFASWFNYQFTRFEHRTVDGDLDPSYFDLN